MPLQVSDGYQFVALTPSDTKYPSRAGPADASNANYTQLLYGIYVGGAGTLALQGEDGVTRNYPGIPAGTLIPIRVVRVMATNTNATSLIGLFPRP